MVFQEVNSFWFVVLFSIIGGLVFGLVAETYGLIENFLTRNSLRVKNFNKVLRKNDVIKVEAVINDRICICDLLSSSCRIVVFYKEYHDLQVGKIYKLVKLASSTTQDLSFEICS